MNEEEEKNNIESVLSSIYDIQLEDDHLMIIHCPGTVGHALKRKKMLYWSIKQMCSLECIFDNTTLFPSNHAVYKCKQCKKLYFNKDLVDETCSGRTYSFYLKCHHGRDDYEDFSFLSMDFPSLDIDCNDGFQVINGGFNSLIVSKNKPFGDDEKYTKTKLLVGKHEISTDRVQNWYRDNIKSSVTYRVMPVLIPSKGIYGNQTRVEGMKVLDHDTCAFIVCKTTLIDLWRKEMNSHRETSLTFVNSTGMTQTSERINEDIPLDVD